MGLEIATKQKSPQGTKWQLKRGNEHSCLNGMFIFSPLQPTGVTTYNVIFYDMYADDMYARKKNGEGWITHAHITKRVSQIDQKTKQNIDHHT